MSISPRLISLFQKKIFGWWATNRRNLPWRETDDPYKILVSEVMLQQTQVSRVLPKYDEFLYFFPDVYALAHAKTSRVLKAWRGMGYNRRALYLKKTAQVVVDAHHGYFPEIESELLKLPGVGKYTAKAIMVFAYRKNTWMIDTNIRQIIVHFFFKGRPSKERLVEEVAEKLVPYGKSWEWHQALMDYGALELRSVVNKPKDVKRKIKIPFKQSDRYFRGRVVDALREKKWSEKKLIHYMTNYYSKSSVFINAIIEGLITDGLVQRRKNTLQLPD